MTTIRRVGVAARYCDIAILGDTAHFSGYIPENTPGGSVAEQTRDVLAQIDESLAAVGSGKARILQATIWLSDMAHYEAMNAVWDAWVAPGEAPARICVGSRLADPDYALEIKIVAAL